MNQIIQTKVIVRHNQKYLFLKKVKDIHSDHIGGWEVPGGKVELEGLPKEAAIREVKEETGLDCQLIKELKKLELEKDGIKTKTYVYLAELINKISNKSKDSKNNVNVKLSDEHSKFVWATYREVDKLENVIYKEHLKRYLMECEKI